MAKPQGFSEIQTEHLKCRSFTHAWDIVLSVPDRVNRRPVLVVSLVCTRCKMPATDIVYANGGDRVKPRHYGYTSVPGYLISDVPSWGGRSEFKRNARLELFQRYTKGANNGH